MGIVKGGALRLTQTALYLLTFCCAAVILGIYSYFLAVQADRNEHIATYEKAVEGISGAAIIYLIFAVLLTCCLGGIAVLAFTAVLLDVLFAGGMIAIAVLTRHGASSCKGVVNTPLGTGNAGLPAGGFDNSSQWTYAVSFRTACRMNTAVFAVSIIAAFLFLVTAAFQFVLVKNHKKEKRYGPGPDNNYTSGYGKKKFWQRKNKKAAGVDSTRDAEMATGGLAVPTHDIRPSHDTGYTGSTAAGGTGNAYDKVEHTNGTHTGYYTAPVGTANPYTTTGTATNY